MSEPGEAGAWIALRPLGPRQTDHELIWSATGLLGLAACRAAPLWQGFAPACPFKFMTGLPCPLCGGTRAAIAWAHLDFPKAFAMNPLVGTAAAVFTAYFAYAVFALVMRHRRRLRVDPFPPGRRGWIARAVALGLFVLNWYYLVYVGR